MNAMSQKSASKDGLAFGICPPEKIRAITGRIAPMIQAGLDEGPGDYRLPHVLERLESGQWALFLATRPGEIVLLAILGEVPFPAYKALFAYIAAGSEMVENLAPLAAEFAKIAKARNCQAMQFQGRLGWARALRRAIPHVKPAVQEIVTFRTEDLQP